MKRETISVVMTGMELLGSNKSRIEHLFQIASGGTSGLDCESYLEIEKFMTAKFFCGYPQNFIESLREYWAPRVNLGVYGDLEVLAHSMLHFLEMSIDGLHDDGLNRRVLSPLFEEIIFFVSIMYLSNNSRGSVNKLLRSFGEKCERTGNARYFVSQLTEFIKSECIITIRDGIAEGIIKQRGPWEVLLTYNKSAKKRV